MNILSAPLPEGFLWQQCIPYLTMATLLCIATFVDFDERMIDEITVSGTLLALVLAAFLPEGRLLDTEQLQADHLVYLHAHSPKDWFIWAEQPRTLLYAMGMMGFWGLASMPKLCTLRGVKRGISLMLASVIRPRRKSLPPGEKRRRRPFTVTTVIAGSSMLGWALLYFVWKWGTPIQWGKPFQCHSWHDSRFGFGVERTDYRAGRLTARSHGI